MNIDRIARGMVDVEPSVDLEARIRASVRRSEARPGQAATWWTWRVAAPAGAIAAAALATALVIGVSWTRSLPAEAQSAKVGPGVVPISQLSEVTSLLPKIPTSQLSKSASQLPKIPTSQLSRVTSRLSAEEIAWMDRRIPALDPVNGLQMDRLRVDSIQPEPLVITPLIMTPVGTDGAGIERRNDR